MFAREILPVLGKLLLLLEVDDKQDTFLHLGQGEVPLVDQKDVFKLGLLVDQFLEVLLEKITRHTLDKSIDVFVAELIPLDCLIQCLEAAPWFRGCLLLPLLLGALVAAVQFVSFGHLQDRDEQAEDVFGQLSDAHMSVQRSGLAGTPDLLDGPQDGLVLEKLLVVAVELTDDCLGAVLVQVLMRPLVLLRLGVLDLLGLFLT